MSPRGPFCNLGKEVMPSYRKRLLFTTAHTPFAEENTVFTQAKATHAARKDVSEPSYIWTLFGHQHQQ